MNPVDIFKQHVGEVIDKFAADCKRHKKHKQTVGQQVLTPLDERTLMSTPPDQTSIMCYQLPGSITRDGRPILGGADINATDYLFAGRIYPKPGQRVAATEQDDEWSEADDVDLDSADLHTAFA